MDNFAQVNRVSILKAQEAYRETNPFILEMYFYYMQDSDIRGLLGWADDDSNWEPKTYPANVNLYCLVAECMLRYYYNVFGGSSDGVDWEDDEGVQSFEQDPQFEDDKAYWERMAADQSHRVYAANDSEEPEEVAAYMVYKNNPRAMPRPRLFSSDIIS